MTPKNTDIVKKINERKISPSKSAWGRVEEKLKRRRIKRKLNLYRNLSVAATFIALLSVMILISEYIPKNKKQTFATNHLYSPAILEELPIVTDDPFYAPDKLIHYNKNGYTNIGG